MESRTVTAPDATTAFAVPNPNSLSRRLVGFFGSGCPASYLVGLVTRPTSDWRLIRKPTLSAIDGRNTKFGAHYCQCPCLVQMWKFPQFRAARRGDRIQQLLN